MVNINVYSWNSVEDFWGESQVGICIFIHSYLECCEYMRKFEEIKENDNEMAQSLFKNND